MRIGSPRYSHEAFGEVCATKVIRFGSRDSYCPPCFWCLASSITTMNTDPLSTAIKEINETKHLLEALLSASESFDYPKAKVAVRSLHRKVRDLARLEAEFQEMENLRAPNIRVVDFNASPVEVTRS